jgi:hypothetical protein
MTRAFARGAGDGNRTPLSAWEVSAATVGPPAETMTCRAFSSLPASDRESPLCLRRSGTYRARHRAADGLGDGDCPWLTHWRKCAVPLFQIFPSPARGSPLSKSTAAARSGSDGISRPRARSSAMYRSRISSRVFPDAAPRAALNAWFQASERCRDSDLYVPQYSSNPGNDSPGSPCDVRACSAPGQAQRRCQTVTETVSFRRARGHALWQEQRHSTMVDFARCPGTGGLAKLTWPHAWCASQAHARDLPGAVAPAPALDTTNPPAACDLRAAHGPLLGMYFGSTERLDPPLFSSKDGRPSGSVSVYPLASARTWPWVDSPARR